MKSRLLSAGVLALALGMVLAGCAKGRSSNNSSGSKAGASGSAAPYTPKTRNVNMFAVPEWIGEMGDIPQFKEFAPKDFGKGGLNDGNEVFSWDPQSMAACVGDTINIGIGNPGPDDHTFTLPDFSINTPVPSFKITNVTIKATKPGIYDYYCTVAEHTRYMHGTLLVFADSDPICG